jgi:hypothetical protein
MRRLYRVASGRDGYAQRALANSVAPPSGGTIRTESSEQSDGTRLNVPQHVRELVDHPPVLRRHDLAGRDVEVRLPRERRARCGVHAAADLELAEAPAERDLRVVVGIAFQVASSM